MDKIKTNLIMIKIKNIIPYKNNTKIHTEKQVGDIRDSIISLGYLSRIEVDENNVILSGHGRLDSLKQIDKSSEKEIEVIQFIGLSEGQKIAYRIAHNKLSLDTGFNEKSLSKEFNLLEDTDLLTSTGFSLKEITNIWDKKDTNLEPKEPKIFKTTCPSCGHVWDTEV